MKNGILLIVEDEADLSEILVEMLAPHCAEIYSAPNGLEALTILENNKQIHAVLSDINMPKMTGFQLLAQLRAKGNPIPFVTLTAYGDQENMRESIRLNATDFITKPFDRKELIEVITKVLAFGIELEAIQRDTFQIFNQFNISPEQLESLNRLNRLAVRMRIENSRYAKLILNSTK